MKRTYDINRLLRNDPVNSKRGAPMGAASYLDAPEVKLYVQCMRLVDGDYGADGTYWGSGGDPMWCGFHPIAPNKVYVRAKDRASALVSIKEQFPEARFFKE